MNTKQFNLVAEVNSKPCWCGHAIGLALAILSLSALAAQRELFVAMDGDDDKNDGLSLTTAYKTIQKAVSQQENNEYLIVTVADGTYELTSPIEMPQISGGIHLRSLSGNPADVIIDGGNRCACLWSESTQARHWFEGLTFCNGVSTALDYRKAGGIYCEQRCFVTNCIIKNCSHILTDGTHGTDIYGGGAYINNWSTNVANVDGWGKPPAIVDTVVDGCAIVSKTSKSPTTQGGGLYVNKIQLHGVAIRSCSVTNDTAGMYLYGGGLCANDSIVSNCLIVGNALVLPNNANAGQRGAGAGAYVSADSADPSTGKNCTVVDSVIAENVSSGSAAGLYAGYRSRILRVAITNNVSISPYGNGGVSQWGGALAVSGGSDTVAERTFVEDCLVEGNDYRGANTFAGGVSICDINNVSLLGTVIRNNQSSHVGGLNIVNSSGVIVSNCVITGNSTTSEVCAVRIQNNIYKFNGAEIPASANRCDPIQIVDSFIVANTNSRPASLQNGGGMFQCNIGTLATGSRVAYVTPILVRNCLFANNQENIGCGWCLRFLFPYSSQRLAYFPGCDDRPIRIEHCTVAGNRNPGNSSYFAQGVYMEGCSLALNSIAFRDFVLTDNLWRTAGTPSVTGFGFWNSESGESAMPDVVRSFGDKEDDCLVVTSENGNIVGGDLKFVDAANGDYALCDGSCLIDRGGAFEGWMGNGRRHSPSRDLSGGYAISANGPYGVSVTRPNSMPRRYGAASDIGCCEFWREPGLIFSVR